MCCDAVPFYYFCIHTMTAIIMWTYLFIKNNAFPLAPALHRALHVQDRDCSSYNPLAGCVYSIHYIRIKAAASAPPRRHSAKMSLQTKPSVTAKLFIYCLYIAERYICVYNYPDEGLLKPYNQCRI